MEQTHNGRVVVGEFHPSAMTITVEREPEVGIAWMACIYDLGKCALGSTPREAVDNLHKTFGASGRSRIYDSALERCGS